MKHLIIKRIDQTTFIEFILKRNNNKKHLSCKQLKVAFTFMGYLGTKQTKINLAKPSFRKVEEKLDTYCYALTTIEKYISPCQTTLE